MTGDVLLNQDTTTIAGPMLIIDVEKGTGLMQGRVKSVFSTVTK
jgi:lipopolysaccharide export system protein LptA